MKYISLVILAVPLTLMYSVVAGDPLAAAVETRSVVPREQAKSIEALIRDVKGVTVKIAPTVPPSKNVALILQGDRTAVYIIQRFVLLSTGNLQLQKRERSAEERNRRIEELRRETEQMIQPLIGPAEVL